MTFEHTDLDHICDTSACYGGHFVPIVNQVKNVEVMLWNQIYQTNFRFDPGLFSLFFCGLTSQSTGMVMSRWSVNLTTLYSCACLD